MRKSMSEILKKIIFHLMKYVRSLDSVIVLAFLIGYFDFGIMKCLVIIVYSIYKILSKSNSNFYNKVAFS